MKKLLLLSSLFFSLAGQAQYYYKDIIGTQETADMVKAYKKANVSRVQVATYDADGTKSDDVFVEQQFMNREGILKTITRSSGSDESVLVSYADANGNVVKTVDSSATLLSTTLYTYNSAGQLQTVVSNTADTSKQMNETEEHRWEYSNNIPVRMLRIKNKMDTTYVTFKTDDAGNVSEERATHKGATSEPVYYYYDANKRLTDIVRYNSKSKRLLPQYMFEYSAANQVIQKITVPDNSSNYIIWRYQYGADGLKTKEAVYDKYKQLTGKIEYNYQRG